MNVDYFSTYTCHCDRYGVIHVQTSECDKEYSGPSKPPAMSIYPSTTTDFLIDFVNDLAIRVARLEQKINV